MKRRRANDITFVAQEIDDAEIPSFANSAAFVHYRAQRFRYGGPGVEKVHINAARTIMARGHGLCDPTILPRPPHTPGIHRTNALGPFLTQQLSKRLVA